MSCSILKWINNNQHLKLISISLGVRDIDGDFLTKLINRVDEKLEAVLSYAEAPTEN